MAEPRSSVLSQRYYDDPAYREHVEALSSQLARGLTAEQLAAVRRIILGSGLPPAPSAPSRRRTRSRTPAQS